ncbi:MAG TPA: PHB depolymerase family esterase [Gemmatimonadaceae bacterium]|nr:PHB depolymerase family esterase [Gemmatimonadaceae bacterium]
MDRSELNRREFGAALATVALGGVLPRMRLDGDPRITARPRSGVTTSVAGERKLGFQGLMDDRDGLLHLPATPPNAPMPLIVLFHGAASSADTQLRRFGSIPDELGAAVLVPDSRGGTWDAIRNEFGPDVRFLDRALAYAFGVVNVDPKRITVAGFSDGATYAIAIGRANGDLFSRIVAFSPGFLIDVKPAGKPKMFVSHGTSDHVLPIDKTSRKLVPALKSEGYDVTYREFDGDHAAPMPVAREGLAFAVAVG